VVEHYGNKGRPHPIIIGDLTDLPNIEIRGVDGMQNPGSHRDIDEANSANVFSKLRCKSLWYREA
jgi:hypothetical protein